MKCPVFHPISPLCTYLRDSPLPASGFVPDRPYGIVALRRVVQPSLSNVVDRVTTVARAACEGRDPGHHYQELCGAVLDLPLRARERLATRDPEAMIPFLGAAAAFLSPLQQLGDVPCCRIYDLRMPGRAASVLYAVDPARTLDTAPEAAITPATVRKTGASVEYVDLLLPSRSTRRAVVLISNAAISPEGYSDIGPRRCRQLASLLDALPAEATTPDAPDALLPLPDWHLDWGLVLLVRYSLGKLGRRRG